MTVYILNVANLRHNCN